MSKSPALLIAQLSDLHLFAGVEQQLMGVVTFAALQAVLKRLQALQPQPDILLLTGDLSHDETQASYERLQDLLASLKIPVYWLAGNHDSLPLMQQVLCQPPISPDQTFQAGGWNFVLLTSWVPGCVHGELSQESLGWLELQLQLRSTHPTLIGLHHPPCRIDSSWLDRINLQNSEALLAVIDRYPQVKLVVFGHIHQAFDEQRRGVRYLGSPATSVQFQPHSAEFALDKAPPGFRLLALLPDGTYETQIERVGYPLKGKEQAG